MATRNEAIYNVINFLVYFQVCGKAFSVMLDVTEIGQFRTNISRLGQIETRGFRFVRLVAFEEVWMCVVSSSQGQELRDTTLSVEEVPEGAVFGRVMQ